MAYSYLSPRTRSRNAAAKTNNTIPDEKTLLNSMSSFYNDSRQNAHRVDMDAAMKERIFSSFGQSAAKVKVFRNPDIESIGEKGFAKGDEVHLAPSVFSSRSMLNRVMDHEMTHIAQQSRGISGGSGALINEAQEHEADSGMGMEIQPTLASADSAPIQGNSLGRLFNRIRGHFKGKSTATGNEHDMFESVVEDHGNSRSYIKQFLESAGNSAAIPEGAEGDEAALRNNEKFKLLNRFEGSLSNYADSPAGQAKTEKARAAIEAQRNSLLGELKGMDSYTGKLAKYRAKLDALNINMDDTSDAEKDRHYSNLDALNELEKKLYALQNKHTGAAYDDDFKALQDILQSKYEDAYAQKKNNGWAMNRNATTDEELLQDQVWNRMVGAQQSGLKIVNGRSNTSMGISNGSQIADGFEKKTFANLGRLAKTETGLKLLDQLSRPSDLAQTGIFDEGVNCIISPVNILGSGNEQGASAGAFEATSGQQTPSPVMGNRYRAKASTSALQSDSDVGGYRKDGTAVLNPQYVLLGHELMHCLHNMTGTNTKNWQGNPAPEQFTHNEEMSAMFGTDRFNTETGEALEPSDAYRAVMNGYDTSINEDRLRKDMGLKSRDYHNYGRAFLRRRNR